MLHNQVCLITGATGGIGKAVAHLFDQQGMRLVLHGRNEVNLQKLNASLSGEHHIVCGDINDSDSRQMIIQEAFANSNCPPTLLINNAGISQFGSFKDMDTKGIEALINTNLIASIDFTQLFLKQVKSNCTIVNVGSAFGSIGYPGYATYCASKFGLKGFTEALQRELSQSSHRICYFAPRATATAINSNVVNKMNIELGNHSDSPERVACELLKLLNSKHQRRAVGWPEKLFARINGLLPELVDKSINKQTQQILNFMKGEQL